MSDQIVVFYWSRLRRKCFLRLVPGPFMLLRHICTIVCPLSCVIFNHKLILKENLRPTFLGQVRLFFFLFLLIMIN